jgi:tyrosine decarboxylase/aspartate 1-decarboxylase
MKLETESLALLNDALAEMEKGFSHLPDTNTNYDINNMRNILLEAAERMKTNYPYFHPFYAGQMLKPPHPIARLAYMLSLWVNPNNHALDGGRASSSMEKEAVAEIARLFGWNEHLGHICGGGTMANMEALWISGKQKPSMRILASEQAHYTHKRITDVLGLEFEQVPCDNQARMDIKALKSILDKGSVGTVVATIGTTATGSIDPLAEIVALQKDYDFRIHADAAYGGYFILANNLHPDSRKAYDSLNLVDSIVIDPHKHGLQPYGCGCVLYKDPGVGVHYKHDSPYTYFTSSDLHLGEISLECSRPGASAVALWATQKLLPLTIGGEFSEGISRCREAAILLYNKISHDPRFNAIFAPELDIVIWAPKAKKASVISMLSRKLFAAAANHDLHLAIFNYPARKLMEYWKDVTMDQEQVTLLRSCLMKHEHRDWLDRIWEKLDVAAREVMDIH